MKDDRVITFVDHLPAGILHTRYLARATTTGRFVLPPTRAECMYVPEIAGRTGADCLWAGAQAGTTDAASMSTTTVRARIVMAGQPFTSLL